MLSEGKPKRGRPSSGVPRAEQVRRAVQKHRRQAKFGEGALLQVELPYYLLAEIRAMAAREKQTLREMVTHLLAEGWKADYLAHLPEGTSLAIRREAAEAMIRQWEAEFKASFTRERNDPAVPAPPEAAGGRSPG